MKLVIVESPAKAKTLERYLGSDYTVMASYGHVRDLPSQDNSVRPDDDFAMDWAIQKDSQKHVKAIIAAARNADDILIAADPDREGEAISWHISELIKQRRDIPKGVGLKRVSFNAITREAVRTAIANPRDLDNDLINAYRARRALDYLYGFTLSPLLWRKLPGARSAGRVQSVSLRLICDRELERDRFKALEYWSIKVDLQTLAKEPFSANLTHADGEKLDKFALTDQKTADAVAENLQKADYQVTEVEQKPVRRRPQPPFVTSTLQQEAARHFRFPVAHTMRVAQSLYEGVMVQGEMRGLITYMRTDGTQITESALEPLRDVVRKRFGPSYLPAQPRHYRSKIRNAQEAHEAIRPTDPTLHPEQAVAFLNADQAKLYELIWKRAAACQMVDALYHRVTVDISAAAGDNRYSLRVVSSRLEFDGFLALYRERSDLVANKSGQDEEASISLPKLAVEDRLTLDMVHRDQHFTEPPPRFTEASLVKRMEELGIGRPSTYAPILSVLQNRGYTDKDGTQLVPEDKGRLVSAFLTAFFDRYVDYNFTANLEQELDDVANGRMGWKTLMEQFWHNFNTTVGGVSERRTSEILDALNTELSAYIFPEDAEGGGRKCPRCDQGELSLKNSRYGPFIGCVNYPECRFTRPLVVTADSSQQNDSQDDEVLGIDPVSDLKVFKKSGRFGAYLQLGEAAAKGDKSAEKRRRISIPKDYDEITLELALQLLALPRQVGLHPETNNPIMSGIGPYGPYLLHDGKYTRLQASNDALTVELNHAVTLIAEAPKGRGEAKAPLAELGNHPDDGALIRVLDGRYGPYVSHGKINATLPREVNPREITLDQALELLAAKKAKPSKASKPSKRKVAVKKPKRKA